MNSVFDIGGGRPKIYFVPLDRRLLGVFYYEGREYDFNFSKLHLMVKTTFSFEELDEEVVWHVRQENIHAAMETEVHCLKKDMLLINYEAPDGSREFVQTDQYIPEQEPTLIEDQGQPEPMPEPAPAAEPVPLQVADPGIEPEYEQGGLTWD